MVSIPDEGVKGGDGRGRGILLQTGQQLGHVHLDKYNYQQGCHVDDKIILSGKRGNYQGNSEKSAVFISFLPMLFKFPIF